MLLKALMFLTLILVQLLIEGIHYLIVILVFQ